MRAHTLAIPSGSLMLPGELVEPDQPRALVVLCHGLPSATPPDPDDPGYAGLARAFAARGIAAMWFTFRGGRGVAGNFSIRGWVDDLDAAITAVRARPGVGALPLSLVGSSLGGVTAVAVGAERDDVTSVATLATPATLEDLIPDPEVFVHLARNRGMIADPSYPTEPDAWAAEFVGAAPERIVGALAPRPVLVVHGDADTDVPYVHAERLFAAARDPKELIRLPGSGHRLRLDPRTVEAVADWIDRTTVPSMRGSA